VKRHRLSLNDVEAEVVDKKLEGFKSEEGRGNSGWNTHVNIAG
jgi:hypothetical protein